MIEALGGAERQSSRGQVPTCHWFVLMLTQGGGCAHLIDHKICCLLGRQVLHFFSALPLYLYFAPSSVIHFSQTIKQPLILFYFSHMPTVLSSCSQSIYYTVRIGTSLNASHFLNSAGILNNRTYNKTGVMLECLFKM